MDDRIGRSVTQKGATNPPKGEFTFPNNTVWGPNGVVAMIEVLAQKEFKKEETESEMKHSINLDNEKYLSVFGTNNGIKQRRGGKFFLKSITFVITEKKKKGVIVKTPKVKIIFDAIVNGRTTEAKGSLGWLRTGK